MHPAPADVIACLYTLSAKNPSHVAQAETPRPRYFSSEGAPGTSRLLRSQ
jgi:hypothetical protein